MLRAAALALLMAFGPVAPAAASTVAVPTIVDGRVVIAPTGVRISVDAESSFDNAGTNPRIIDAEFATTDYYSFYDVRAGRVFLSAKTSAELNAMASPPDNPFTVDVTLTMTNDEEQEASGTITFKTTYARTVPVAPPAPSFTDDPRVMNAPAAALVSTGAEGYFDNAGTKPRIIDAVFSTTDYYSVHRVSNGQVFVQVKTAEELNALETPPPSPFTVDVTVTMTNDEGQTASGTIVFRTDYARASASAGPTFTDNPGVIAASPGALVTASAGDYFDNAGTNPRITDAAFSTTEYYSTHSVQNGVLHVQPKTAAELNALETPPPSPFTVSVTVTMTNDEEQTASGTIRFRTTYARTVPATPPVFTQTETRAAYPGLLLAIQPVLTFDNAGTNPRITEAVFSALEYLDTHSINQGYVFLRVKTAEELAALETPPPSTFTFDVTVTMTNDEDLTASGTITFQAIWTRPPPVFSQTERIGAPPGQRVMLNIADMLDNAGTNPRITYMRIASGAERLRDYGIVPSQGVFDRFYVEVMTAAELAALETPPDSSFTTEVELTIANDEEQTAKGTVTFQTEWTPPPPPPVFKNRGMVRADPGVTLTYEVANLFDNAGTNPIFSGADLSPSDYYEVDRTQLGDGILRMKVKTAAELSSLENSPFSPFTVDVTVTMTNDEGHTASGTFTLQTVYIPAALEQPYLSDNIIVRNAAPGSAMSLEIRRDFHLAGTRVRLQSYEWSTLEYYDTSYTTVSRGGVMHMNPAYWVKVKTAEELNALETPPPSPFTVDLTFTLINDEGDTLDGTIRFMTTYARIDPPPPPPPVFSQTETRPAAPGFLLTIQPADAFDNAGTNPRITEAVFSAPEYLDTHSITPNQRYVWLKVKTAEGLAALEEPPPTTFTFDVAVTMTNDEGQTASGTITFETVWTQPPPPLVFKDQGTVAAAPGATLTFSWADLFENAGDTANSFSVKPSSWDYYDFDWRDPVGPLQVKVKTAAELAALETPPPSPFTVEVTVTMIRAEGAPPASGTISFRTEWTPPPPPTFRDPGTVVAAPGATLSYRAEDLFDNAGEGAAIVGLSASRTDLYVLAHRKFTSGVFELNVKTAEELNAMASPPSSPFTVEYTVEMVNEAGQTASGTITFETTYVRTAAIAPAPPPQQGQEGDPDQ
ncbi:MAG: hypothetical protein OXN81_10165 [Alphaproteobacteria bacterium]|nr:hypothetical protein [Alphaproteobacteria bacterium]